MLRPALGDLILSVSMPTPTAIDVRDVRKTFRIPTNRALTLRDRLVHPFQRRGFRELPVLRGVSLSVESGEFFGVVGRNGSGKSTLLKLIASIYRADAGSIRIAGRLSPFIELGVGFHPELAAYDNVVLNGVMMGLSPREARRRFDAVIEFAELDEFRDLKLRNYSSGMRVRLAFAVMVQVDADIMLIDEVLAVGDAAFQQKCMDTFRDLQDRGKTIVLVTHSMGTVAEFCHRAVLIDNGLIEQAGGPDEVAARYNEINAERAAEADATAHPAGPEPSRLARVHDSWVESEAGDHVTQLDTGEPIRLCTEVEALDTLDDACLAYSITDRRGTRLFTPAESDLPALGPLPAGARVQVQITLANPFAAGEYELVCGVRRPGAEQRLLSNVHSVPLILNGPPTRGVLAGLDHEVEVLPAGEIQVTPR